MARFILTVVLTGLLLALMDGLIYANPYAVKLMEVYKPITKQSVNAPIGLLVDLFYGFVISAIYVIVRPVLPSESGVARGLLYGLGIWFFRIVMGIVSSCMMFNIPISTLIYLMLTGLAEMLVVGLLNGLLLKK